MPQVLLLLLLLLYKPTDDDDILLFSIDEYRAPQTPLFEMIRKERRARRERN
jgi:hypothetical protein